MLRSRVVSVGSQCLIVVDAFIYGVDTFVLRLIYGQIFVDGRVFFAGTINVFSIKVSLAKTLNFV